MITTTELSGRQRALLRAVAAGRCELSCSQVPDMFVDGLCCCDQLSARQLVRAQLVTTGDGFAGRRVAAALTAAGQAVLAAA